MNKELLEALKKIPVSQLTYHEWVQVGMALKSEGIDCLVWDTWSQADSRYHDGECERKWQSFRSEGITGKTIFAFAKRFGYKRASSDYAQAGAIGWDDPITCDHNEAQSTSRTPTEDLKLYLQTLFQPDEYVSYVIDSYKDADGRYKPNRAGYCDRTAGELIQNLDKHPDDIGATLGDWNKEAGAWIRINPVDGKGGGDKNVTAYRYVLVESDTMPVAEQYDLYIKLELPIACIVHSGGKSLHAIVRIDAQDRDEYRKRVTYLYDFLQKHGMTVDQNNKNPSRLSRLPGITRGDKMQYLVATRVGRKTWADWMDFAEGISDELPPLVSLSEYAEAPKLPDELISGVLRCGHKMLISGSSKAGKSFLLMELCVALAEGTKWLGFSCRQGKVLYVNLEIDPASCINRFITIYNALGIERKNSNNIVIWNLRGNAVPLTSLVPKLVRRIKDEGYEAVIIDPIYKVITGDENNASDMAAFCNQFDKICTETGCSVIYCHHHSKGAQGSKRAIDRASGSGVFARDPDAQLDMIQLKLTDEQRYILGDGRATAWRMESSLREFANFAPINFWFEFPLHRLDDSLKAAHAEGSPNANLQSSGKRTSEQERKDKLDAAFDICAENGMCKITDMAEFLEVTRRTVSNYLKEFEDEYTVVGGVVSRKQETCPE